jgi:hypothetical protein
MFFFLCQVAVCFPYDMKLGQKLGDHEPLERLMYDSYCRILINSHVCPLKRRVVRFYSAVLLQCASAINDQTSLACDGAVLLAYSNYVRGWSMNANKLKIGENDELCRDTESNNIS